MENLFETWCHTEQESDGSKVLWRAVEQPDARQKVLNELAHRTRSHYVSDEEIAKFLEDLDYADAAKVLQTQYPETPNGRSADLGEILGTEVIEERCGHRVPIRKLRDKDHREQAMRGEDIIGVRVDGGQLGLLKGEAKSAQVLGAATIEGARSGLEANAGRPTAHALIFVARRLLDRDNAVDQALAKQLLTESVKGTVPKARLAHCLFTLTGNPAREILQDDFSAADGGRDQFVIQLHVPDHANLVRCIYEQLNHLALD